MNDEAAVEWLREQVNWTLEYARANAARRPITPMRSHEMRDLVAGCEAELAILDEHAEGWQIGDPLRDCQWEAWPCRTIRLVASGYRHRPGYAEHWA